MKLKYYISTILLSTLALSGCYDRDIEVADPIVNPIENLEYTIDDDTLRVTWNSLEQNNLKVKISSNAETKILDNAPTSYKFGVVKVGKEYSFTLNVLDEKGNMSTGRSFYFTRQGGLSVEDLMAKQDGDTKNLVLTWDLPKEKATKIEVRYDGKKIELAGNVTTYTISNADEKVYNLGVVSFNEAGKSSETVYTTIRVGSTKVGFLGMQATKADFLANADDDEIAAGQWFFANYPTGEYISFDQIKAGSVDLSKYRVLWWIRDVVGAPSLLPAVALDPTVLTAMKNYHANGGNLLLNMHAVSYLWSIGRMIPQYPAAIGTGAGGDNPDIWSVNVSIGEKHDESTHPIHRKLPYVMEGKRKTIRLIGPGWKDDHNNVYLEIPAFYGLGNADENAYLKICDENQIRILGTWSGITDYFMMANFETYPNSQFKGTSIAIGVGAFEWHQNNVVNPYQKNIEDITRNAIEYLKTK